MRYRKYFKSVGMFLIQLAAWNMFILFAPLMICVTSGNISDAKILFYILAGTIEPCMSIYFINYYILVPHLFFKSRIKKVWFFIINVLAWGSFCLIIIFRGMLPTPAVVPEWLWISITAGVTITMVLGIGSIGLAIAIRNSQRTRAMKIQLNEEKRRRTEAELIWLKNQLNPHFLFNCLNNISSLVYLDADKAQDSIGKLSELLRYAIYESEKKFVPLQKEIEFIRNYIELMSLRCNENTTVDFDVWYDNANLQVIPLVFISLIENAFKHGVSASKKSFIRISIVEKDGVLTFSSENSNHAKSGSDHSGSGIGLANTRKRLDMIYGGKYQWHQHSDESVFKVEIIITE